MRREVWLGSDASGRYVWHFALGDRVKNRSSGDPNDVGVVEKGKRTGESEGGPFSEMYEVRRNKDGLCYWADVENLEKL
jgi:hypothetical protein